MPIKFRENTTFVISTFVHDHVSVPRVVLSLRFF